MALNKDESKPAATHEHGEHGEGTKGGRQVASATTQPLAVVRRDNDETLMTSMPATQRVNLHGGVASSVAAEAFWAMLRGGDAKVLAAILLCANSHAWLECSSF